MTIRDVRVTKVFYPILLDLARDRRTTTYGGLVNEGPISQPRRRHHRRVDPPRRWPPPSRASGLYRRTRLPGSVQPRAERQHGWGRRCLFRQVRSTREAGRGDGVRLNGRRSRVRCVRRLIRARDRFVEPTEAKPGGGEASPVGLHESTKTGSQASGGAAWLHPNPTPVIRWRICSDGALADHPYRAALSAPDPFPGGPRGVTAACYQVLFVQP
jgi:hypothetical protein